MKALIQRTIDLLKNRVKDNLETINQNQTRLNEILNQPVSAERTYHIEKNYEANKALLAENNDFLSLQLSLLNFIEKYKDTLNLIDDSASTDLIPVNFLDDEELFDLTIQGKLDYNTKHPKFDDETFFNKLLGYYASVEAYEKCKMILSLRKKGQIR